jgi:hypothetical protein
LVLPPLLSAYSLLRKRWWAKAVVLATCLSIGLINLVALMQVFLSELEGLSAKRIVFIVLYFGTSMPLSLYGVWSVRRNYDRVKRNA